MSRHLAIRWKKVAEAILVCCVTATMGFLLMLWKNDCKPLGLDPTNNAVQVCVTIFENCMVTLKFT